jgi:hypothetical protein
LTKHHTFQLQQPYEKPLNNQLLRNAGNLGNESIFVKRKAAEKLRIAPMINTGEKVFFACPV